MQGIAKVDGRCVSGFLELIAFSREVKLKEAKGKIDVGRQLG